jgi:hemolysin activation/secretion protein
VLPEQGLENGIVLFRVFESVIGAVRVEGNRFFDEANVRRSLPSLHEGYSPNIGAVSQDINLANENPARKVALELRSGSREDEIDAVVKVDDSKPWKAGITFDNTGDSRTGEFRIGALLQYANLFNRDHMLALQYITSPTELDNVHIYGMSYRIPIYGVRGSVDITAAYSDVNSGTLTLGGGSVAQMTGAGTRLGVRYNQSLPELGIYEHKLSLGLDYRAYENQVDLLGSPVGNDVTVHPVSLLYTGRTTWKRVEGGFYLAAARNLPGGWNDSDGQSSFDAARSGAPENYFVYNAGANLLYSFEGDWMARALVNAQYTVDPLVPGEQFGLGGEASVRGFREREVTEDRGYSASFEIYTPNLAKLGKIGAVQCRALLFYDIGYGSRINPLPGETGDVMISSFGPGIRISDGKYFAISADYGFIIDPIPDVNSTLDGRWHIAMTMLF